MNIFLSYHLLSTYYIPGVMVALCVYYLTESLQQPCEVGFFNRYFSKEETLAQSDAGAQGHLASVQQRGSLNHGAHCFSLSSGRSYCRRD